MNPDGLPPVYRATRLIMLAMLTIAMVAIVTIAIRHGAPRWTMAVAQEAWQWVKSIWRHLTF